MKDFFDYTLFHINTYQLKVISILLVFLLFIVIKIILWVIKKSINNTTHIDKAKKYAIYNLVKYVIVVFSIIATFQVLGFNFTLLLGGAEALLVSIGLGLQNIFSDFISGIILLIESKIKINDIVEVDGLLCRVSDIKNNELITKLKQNDHATHDEFGS